MSDKKTVPESLLMGRYRVLKSIGSGGLGQVFYGMDEQLHRPVAVKRLHKAEDIHEKYRDAWVEARVLASLQHPNIVTLFDFGEDGNGAFFVMEYIDGETLENLGSVGLLSEKDFTDIAKQCLSGIGAAHELGIVHRDIKPTNIMVQKGATGELIAKILDFGLAKFQQTPEHQTTDHENNLLGSIYFMAPEQFSRDLIDARADIYALGNVFYYGLTGRMAHEGDSIQQIIYSHLQNPVRPLMEYRPDLSPALCLWVHQLMARSPLERPQSAIEALQLLESGSNVPQRAARSERKPGHWLKRGFLCGLALAFSVVVFFLLKVKKESSAVHQVPPEIHEPQAVITDLLPFRDGDASGSHTPKPASLDPLNGPLLLSSKNQEVEVAGVPVKVGENKDGSILYLNFSEDYRSSLSLVFFVKDNPGQFTRAGLELFVNKKIRVRGIVGEYKGAPQFKMDSLEQIQVDE